MNIEVSDKLGARILDAIEGFESISSELRRINKKLDRIEGRGEQEAIDLAALTAKVEAETTLDQSIKALIEGLADEFADQPELAALRDKLKTSGDALIAAVKANV